MVDAAATAVMQAPSLASSSGQRPANDRNAGPVVPAPPAPGEASGIVAATSFTAMRKVVDFKEMGMGDLANVCGLGMALKAMADSEKNPILIDGALGTVSKPMSCPGVPSPFALFVELLSHVEAFILLEPDVAVVWRPLH